MKVPAHALKYCSLALSVAAVVGAAFVLLPGRGSAHEGGYLNFTGPGSGYLEVPDEALLNPSEAITVEAWVYLNSYAGWGTSLTDCPVIVGKNLFSAYGLDLGCGGDVMDSYINGINYYADTPTIPLHTWTHLAMTYDGPTRRNFQDGQPVTEIDDSEGPIGDTADPLRIGNDVGWDFSPNGRIDDVRIWNVARTQAEIAAGMVGVDPGTPGLVADWTFDDGSLTDETSGLAGTLVGSVQLGDGPSPGDVNCDGNVTIEDGSGLLESLAGVGHGPAILAPVCNDGGAQTDGHPARYDASCNGQVNVLDVLTIFKFEAALIELPTSCP